MSRKEYIENKVFHQVSLLQQQIAQWRFVNRTIVFTNGCFDVLHPGHFHLLNTAITLAPHAALVVGLNSDASVRKLKGESRPVHAFGDRALALASLFAVDAVIGFEEDTPANLIAQLVPDVLVKGGDYSPQEVVGADIVINAGGKVEIISFLAGHSTTNILTKK